MFERFLHDKQNQCYRRFNISFFKNPNNNTSSSSLVADMMRQSGSRESLMSNRSFFDPNHQIMSGILHFLIDHQIVLETVLVEPVLAEKEYIS
ncbi:10534_t:CDS:2 [Entrophospora sp. SA101]|nr:10534_t:CDS:2 [Entrophospora sp. SA101]